MSREISSLTFPSLACSLVYVWVCEFSIRFEEEEKFKKIFLLMTFQFWYLSILLLTFWNILFLTEKSLKIWQTWFIFEPYEVLWKKRKNNGLLENPTIQTIYLFRIVYGVSSGNTYEHTCCLYVQVDAYFFLHIPWVWGNKKKFQIKINC